MDKKRILRYALVFSVLFHFSLLSCKKSPTTPDIESLSFPTIWINAFELSFTAKVSGGNPSAQVLKVKNSGIGTLNYTISSDSEWLSVEPTSGSSEGEIIEHSVSVDKSGLTAKDEDYTATVTVNCSDAANNPQKAAVTLILEKEPRPKIRVSPASLSFTASEGGSNPSSQNIEIKNEGEGSLRYTISDDSSWIEIIPVSGALSKEGKSHNVSVNIAGLNDGIYNGTITVTDASATNSPQTVNVTLTITEQPTPTIWVNHNSLSFSAQEGSSNPSSQELKVKNSGGGTLNYKVSSDASWLSGSPESGSSGGEENNHTVSVDAGGLSSNTYSGTITISDVSATNSPQTVNVTLTITEQPTPTIWVNHNSLSFSAQEGSSNPSSQELKVKNSGGGTLNYQVSSDASWLSVSPESGSSGGEENNHTVSVDVEGLSSNTYSGTINISDVSATNSPQTVNVTLTITEQPIATIWINTTSLSFSTQEGGSNPSDQKIKVKNSGGGTLNYQISKDASWLSASPTSGSSSGDRNTHTVSVDIGSLGAGTYNGMITVSDVNATNSPQTVDVTLAITQQASPTIWINTASLSFSAQEGGSNPSSQSISIKNSGGGTLSYQISKDASWLSVSPTSGSSGGETNSHTVSVDIGGLSAGTHNGILTITDSNATNNPQTVSVTLTITQPPQPTIWINTASLSFSAQEGGSNPSSQNISIKNSGGGTLSYQISSDSSWLSVSPTSGSSGGETNSHTVSVDIGGLSAGTHNGILTITDSNATNNPQTVSVTLTITQPPQPTIWINTASLSFSAQEGGSNPSSQNISIKNSGGGTLSYQISSDSSWLSVSPTSGSSGGETNSHTVSVDIGGLSAGAHNGTLTISDSNATNSPQTVSVTLQLSSPPSDNEISISRSPSSGGTDTIVTISISVKGNTQEINYFGLDLTFDANMFSFQSVSQGGLTGDWAAVDGNEVSSGTVKIGGFAGSGTPIPSGSTGDIVVIQLKVTCSGCSDGQQCQVCMSSLTDDIAGMTPAPSCKTFAYSN